MNPFRRLNQTFQSSTWRQPSFVVVLISLGLVIFFLIAGGREIYRRYTVNQQVRRLQHDVLAEESKLNKLQALTEYLASPTFQEREARLNLGLKKPGEKVYIVPDGSTPIDQSLTNQPTSDTVTSETSGPVQWWQWLFAPRSTSSHSSTS